MIFLSIWANFAVVIEEIQEDEKPVDDNSRLQLAVRTPPAESVESEDEDGFPVSESKKSSKGSSKKDKNLNNGTSTEDRKRKSDAINDPHKSSGYMLVHCFPLADLFNHNEATCVKFCLSSQGG